MNLAPGRPQPRAVVQSSRRPSLVERWATRWLAALAAEAAGLVVIAILVVAAIVLGAATFGMMAALLFGPYILFGSPALVAAPLGTAWFFGSLFILFRLLVRLYRWLGSAIDTERIERRIDPSIAEEEELERRAAETREPAGDFATRLAAADARHAPPVLPGRRPGAGGASG